MASTLIELKYSGRPNRATSVDPATSDRLWSVINDLPVSAVPIDLCWKCLVNLAPAGSDVLFSRTEGERHEWAYVFRTYAVTHRGSHSGVDRLRAMIDPIVAKLPAVTESAALKKPAAGGAKADWRRCGHAANHHTSLATACACGMVADAASWLPFEICESSNCFNYAVKDVWCRFGGMSVGATPASRPSTITSYTQWAAILAPDGLIPAADPITVPPGATGGWHVALAVNASDFHFLRLDGTHWTHKHGPLPPQACDASGAAMPARELERANLCDYRLVGYFYVPGRLRIDH